MDNAVFSILLVLKEQWEMYAKEDLCPRLPLKRYTSSEFEGFDADIAGVGAVGPLAGGGVRDSSTNFNITICLFISYLRSQLYQFKYK